MPYIDKKARPQLDELADPLGQRITSLGELNYVITTIILGYLGEDARYSDYAGVHGVLGDVWDELRRRRVNDYEDRKIRENGDLDWGVSEASSFCP